MHSTNVSSSSKDKNIDIYIYIDIYICAAHCVEWVAVIGSSLEGEHKAHGHSCIALGALCKGNRDLYVLNKNKHHDIESDLVT